ncbi:MAG: carboxymuconolactone decarboxylase family protein [Steroidobacteraceae bacterium]
MLLSEPVNAEAAAYLEQERAASGYVMNLERAWAWRPDVAGEFARLRKLLAQESGLSAGEMALLTCATAHALGDSYCSLAWGTRLAGMRGAAAAAAILRGTDPPDSTAREAALRQWAAQVVRDPNGASASQVERLRRAGLSDREIFEATLQVAFRLAFSAVNDALGARPDLELVAAAPAELRAAVSYGRPPHAGSPVPPLSETKENGGERGSDARGQGAVSQAFF